MKNMDRYNYKFEIGQKVQVREDLMVDGEYHSHDGKVMNYFSAGMVSARGKMAEIIGKRSGHYVLNIDVIHLYTDGMLIDVFDEGQTVFTDQEYIYNEDVESIVDVLMEGQISRAIDNALDEKKHISDPEGFYELIDQLKIFKNKKNKNQEKSRE